MDIFDLPIGIPINSDKVSRQSYSRAHSTWLLSLCSNTGTVCKKYVRISGISKILWEYWGEINTQNNKSSNHMARTDFGNSQQKVINSRFFLKERRQ